MKWRRRQKKTETDEERSLEMQNISLKSEWITMDSNYLSSFLPFSQCFMIVHHCVQVSSSSSSSSSFFVALHSVLYFSLSILLSVFPHLSSSSSSSSLLVFHLIHVVTVPAPRVAVAMAGMSLMDFQLSGAVPHASDDAIPAARQTLHPQEEEEKNKKQKQKKKKKHSVSEGYSTKRAAREAAADRSAAPGTRPGAARHAAPTHPPCPSVCSVARAPPPVKVHQGEFAFLVFVVFPSIQGRSPVSRQLGAGAGGRGRGKWQLARPPWHCSAPAGRAERQVALAPRHDTGARNGDSTASGHGTKERKGRKKRKKEKKERKEGRRAKQSTALQPSRAHRNPKRKRKKRAERERRDRLWNSFLLLLLSSSFVLFFHSVVLSSCGRPTTAARGPLACLRLSL
mgnify:CR=1 FL=1